MKTIITKCISTAAAEPQTSEGEEEEDEGSFNSLDGEIQAKKTSKSNKNATMLKKFSVFTSNHRLSSSTSSSSGSGSGASGTSQISSNPNPESSSSSSSSAASSSSTSSKVKKTIYHHHNHHHNHHHHNLPHIQSYQSLSSVNPSSIDAIGGKSVATASKHNSFIGGSKPLNRNSRRVSMYELGYGKTESYTKLEKLGEVT